jgi:hypothetical protein
MLVTERELRVSLRIFSKRHSWQKSEDLSVCFVYHMNNILNINHIVNHYLVILVYCKILFGQ